MGNGRGKTGTLSVTGKIAGIENLEIILFFSVKSPCRVDPGLKKEVYHVNYCIILTRLIELLIVMFG